MEKRTLFAFILSFIVLIGYSVLFAPKEEPPPLKEEPGKKQEAMTQPSTPLVDTLKKSEAIAPLQTSGVEKEIIVETPLYKATFSTLDAALKNIQLKKYYLTTDTHSPMVEIGRMKDPGRALIRVAHEKPGQSERPAQPGITYHASEESLVLNTRSGPREIAFSAMTSDGLSIIQTYRFHPDRYPIDLIVDLSNNKEDPSEGNLKVVVESIPPKEKSSYYSFLGVRLLLNNDLQSIETTDMEKEKNYSGRIEWMTYEADYFMTALIPEEPSQAIFLGRLLPTGLLEANYILPPAPLGTHQKNTSHFMIYVGPRDLTILRELGKRLDLAINFGWTDIIAKPLLYTLRFFNQYAKNYGISIILLTVLIKILFWPLTHKSYKSMKEMQKLQPLMAKLREKYKNNREQMNKELMGLYKTYKVNPMGGCLPMVIQIPVFFALFRILGDSIELRHAPFFLWINDLSAPDRLFEFPFSIPFMSPPHGIPVLTLLMGVSMFFQQKMTPTPGDPSQAKIMMFLPVIFTFMFINFPSGLVLYWLVNNILSIGQQYRVIKRSA